MVVVVLKNQPTTEGTTQAIYKQFFNFTEPNAENIRDGAGWSMIDGTDGTNAVSQKMFIF